MLQGETHTKRKRKREKNRRFGIMGLFFGEEENMKKTGEIKFHYQTGKGLGAKLG
jgi:hypothetical protein